jgi:hypothetical protein
MLVSNFPLLPHDQNLNSSAAPTSLGAGLGFIKVRISAALMPRGPDRISLSVLESVSV